MGYRVRISEPRKELREQLTLTTFSLYDDKDVSKRTISECSLQEVFNTLARNPKTPISLISKNFDIHIDLLKSSISYMMAYMPEKIARIYGLAPNARRLLIDENLSPKLNLNLWGILGPGIHTSQLKVDSYKDNQLWRRAVSSDIQAIITRDTAVECEETDLCMIALHNAFNRAQNSGKDRRKKKPLPLVIGFKAGSGHKVRELLKTYKSDIAKACKDPVSPLIFVDEEGVKPGPTFDELAKSDWETVHQSVRDLYPSPK